MKDTVPVILLATSVNKITFQTQEDIVVCTSTWVEHWRPWKEFVSQIPREALVLILLDHNQDTGVTETRK